MPQKRKKKGTARLSRALPKLPPGDEGSQLTAQQKREKLALMLDDFDAEVKSRMEQLRSRQKQAISQVKAANNMELLKLPKHIRETRLSDYLMAGGDMNALLLNAHKSYNITTALNEKPPTREDDTVVMQSTDESEQTNVTKAGKGEKKVDQSMAPPALLPPRPVRTRRTCASKQTTETPLHRRPIDPTSLATPVDTPRFDPRLLGKTPVVVDKTYKHKSLSVFSIPCGGKEALIVTKETDETTIPALDPSQIKELVQIQCKLSAILQRHDDSASVKQNG